MTTSPPPGWHPDPEGTDKLRWWDGTQWTSATRLNQPDVAPPPPPGAPPPMGTRQGPPGSAPPAAKKSRRGLWIALGLVVLVVIFIAAVSGGSSDDKESNTAANSSTETTTTSTLSPAEASASAASASAAEAAAASSRAAEASAAAAAAAAERARQTDKSTYTQLSDREWQLIAKNPAAHIGEKVVVYGKVTQFDAATGNDAFRASVDGQPQDYNIFTTNTVVTEGLSGILTNVVQDDLVTIFARVEGAFSYDTTMGGSATAPKLRAYVVDVTGSDG